jgi:CRP-like cAMP-binding protein
MLTATMIDEFKKAGIQRSYRANEVVFLHNEPATGMYLILQGEAKVMKRLPTGDNVEVATVRTGETTGEISLLLEKPHTATVIAKTEIQIVLLTRNRLNELKKTQPEVALRLYEALAQTLARHLYERPW